MKVVETRGERAPTVEWAEEGGCVPVSTVSGLGSDTGAANHACNSKFTLSIGEKVDPWDLN